ncbi:HsdM family class I SAM-dependent methyltransferase [Rhodococcus sp. 008]|uniref:HsdM family class I SAM-dependent methyltransferase n=1 Tax=Rhodococcus sp. 008 TaxID=1723645 RepID=UPI0018D37C0A|nr:N-6 DNA methylase [Rhodococcus sp. 008]
MSVKRSAQHPAIEYLFAKADDGVHAERDTNRYSGEHTTSVSLAHALAVGCLSRLDPSQSSVDIWDPAVGSGFAGSLVLEALQSAGVQARYRGQDINESAVEESRRRFEGVADVEIAQGNTLAKDAFEHFMADLVIVDPPWGVSWAGSASAVEARQQRGEFSYGLPQKSDSTWLFISLAFEKLRPTEEGGGRIAALVNPSALWAGGASGAVRRRIVEAGCSSR